MRYAVSYHYGNYAHRALTIATQLNIPLKAECEALLESLQHP